MYVRIFKKPRQCDECEAFFTKLVYLGSEDDIDSRPWAMCWVCLGTAKDLAAE